MSSSTTTPLTLPTGLAPVAGLPSAAHVVLHRELLHIHSSLHLILLILRGPWDTVTPNVVDTITCPRLSATLRALETSLEQIRRSTCTTLVYTDQLCAALELLHPIRRLTTPSPDLNSSSLDLPRLIFSPPSPPSTTPPTTTTGPSPPLTISLLTPFLPLRSTLRHRRGCHALAHALALDLPRDDFDFSFSHTRPLAGFRKDSSQMPFGFPCLSLLYSTHFILAPVTCFSVLLLSTNWLISTRSC